MPIEFGRKRLKARLHSPFQRLVLCDRSLLTYDSFALIRIGLTRCMEDRQEQHLLHKVLR